MNRKLNPSDEAATQILQQARLVASEVLRVEAIVDHAIGAASIAMAAMEKVSDAEMAALAKETLQIARRAAADVLAVAKKEAGETLRLAAVLAESTLIEPGRGHSRSKNSGDSAAQAKEG